MYYQNEFITGLMDKIGYHFEGGTDTSQTFTNNKGIVLWIDLVKKEAFKQQYAYYGHCVFTNPPFTKEEEEVLEYIFRNY